MTIETKTHYEILKEAFEKCGIEFETFGQIKKSLCFPDKYINSSAKGKYSIDLDFDKQENFVKIDVID